MIDRSPAAAGRVSREFTAPSDQEKCPDICNDSRALWKSTVMALSLSIHIAKNFFSSLKTCNNDESSSELIHSLDFSSLIEVLSTQEHLEREKRSQRLMLSLLSCVLRYFFTGNARKKPLCRVPLIHKVTAVQYSNKRIYQSAIRFQPCEY